MVRNELLKLIADTVNGDAHGGKVSEVFSVTLGGADVAVRAYDIRLVTIDLGNQAIYVNRPEGIKPETVTDVLDVTLEALGLSSYEVRLKEICVECGENVGLGSGKPINAYPYLTTYTGNILNGRPYPEGEYICFECDEGEDEA